MASINVLPQELISKSVCFLSLQDMKSCCYVWKFTKEEKENIHGEMDKRLVKIGNLSKVGEYLCYQIYFGILSQMDHKITLLGQIVLLKNGLKTVHEKKYTVTIPRNQRKWTIYKQSLPSLIQLLTKSYEKVIADRGPSQLEQDLMDLYRL